MGYSNLSENIGLPRRERSPNVPVRKGAIGTNSSKHSNEKDSFLKSLQSAGLNTMWQKILGFDFLDYELDKWQTAVLKIQVITFLINFNESAAQFQADVLSNEVSQHVSQQMMCGIKRANFASQRQN